MLDVAGRLGTVICKGAVYFTGFVDLDLGIGIFLFSFFFLVKIQLLHCLHLLHTTTYIHTTTLSMYVIDKKCFIPKHRASWTKSD